MPNYMPFDRRTPDSQYNNLLNNLLANGERVITRQGPRAFTLWCPPDFHYEIANGFPVITDRDIVGKDRPKSIWRQAIAEICAFINGARTLDELESFGCYWWGDWATKAKCSKRGLATGDLGPASYGAIFHDYPDFDGKPYDQWAHLVAQIEEFPADRTHKITPWHPAGLARDSGRVNKATIAPCHGDVMVRIINGGLYMKMEQRSADVPIGVPANIVQYAAVGLMLETLTGYPLVEYVHRFCDAHYYEDQEGAVQQMATREARILPTVNLTKAGRAVANIHDFRAEHFELSEYNPHPAISGIPVAP